MNQLTNLILLPQECGGNYQFSAPMYMTRGFVDRFGDDQASIIAIAALKKVIKERVNSLSGADYLQVFEYARIRFWLIDDSDHLTALLPEDY